MLPGTTARTDVKGMMEWQTDKCGALREMQIFLQIPETLYMSAQNRALDMTVHKGMLCKVNVDGVYMETECSITEILSGSKFSGIISKLLTKTNVG